MREATANKKHSHPERRVGRCPAELLRWWSLEARKAVVDVVDGTCCASAAAGCVTVSRTTTTKTTTTTLNGDLDTRRCHRDHSVNLVQSSTFLAARSWPLARATAADVNHIITEEPRRYYTCRAYAAPAPGSTSSLFGLLSLKPKLHLLQLVVDLLCNTLYNKMYNKCTLNIRNNFMYTQHPESWHAKTPYSLLYDLTSNKSKQWSLGLSSSPLPVGAITPRKSVSQRGAQFAQFRVFGASRCITFQFHQSKTNVAHNAQGIMTTNAKQTHSIEQNSTRRQKWCSSTEYKL